MMLLLSGLRRRQLLSAGMILQAPYQLGIKKLQEFVGTLRSQLVWPRILL